MPSLAAFGELLDYYTNITEVIFRLLKCSKVTVTEVEQAARSQAAGAHALSQFPEDGTKRADYLADRHYSVMDSL